MPNNPKCKKLTVYVGYGDKAESIVNHIKDTAKFKRMTPSKLIMTLVKMFLDGEIEISSQND